MSQIRSTKLERNGRSKVSAERLFCEQHFKKTFGAIFKI